MNAPKATSASTIIITDHTDQNFNYCTYILNLLNRKLNAINIKLGQVLIVTEKSQLIDQLKLLTENHRKDWILITTTNESNDKLAYSLINEENNNYDKIDFFNSPIPIYDRRIFVLGKSSFHFNLSTCLKHIMKCQSNKLAFTDQAKYAEFIAKLSQIVDVKINPEAEFKNEQVAIKHLFSNYYEKLVQVEFDTETVNGKILLGLYKEYARDFLEDNFVNGDFYVYELAHYSCCLKDMTDDITFLRKKIDQNVFNEKLKLSIKIIEQCFSEYKPEEVSISFNGGKDCCVVLFLAYAVSLRMGIKSPLHAVLIKIKNQFNEMTDFVNSLVKSTYTKQFIEFIVFNETKSMKNALWDLQAMRPEFKAILIGTRRSDGAYFKDLKAFAYTDGDWPKYMRVNPILDWTFSEIWYFMRLLKLPYCSLYDRGYTSIDNTLNTVQNKDLLVENGVDYLPAWRLQDGESERYSRKKSN